MDSKSELIEILIELNKSLDLIVVKDGCVPEEAKRSIFKFIDVLDNKYDPIRAYLAELNGKIFNFEMANLRFKITIDGIRTFIRQLRDDVSADQLKIINTFNMFLAMCDSQYYDCSLGLNIKEERDYWYFREESDFNVMRKIGLRCSILETDMDNQLKYYNDLMNFTYALQRKIEKLIQDPFLHL